MLFDISYENVIYFFENIITFTKNIKMAITQNVIRIHQIIICCHMTYKLFQCKAKITIYV